MVYDIFIVLPFMLSVALPVVASFVSALVMRVEVAALLVVMRLVVPLSLSMFRCVLRSGAAPLITVPLASAYSTLLPSYIHCVMRPLSLNVTAKFLPSASVPFTVLPVTVSEPPAAVCASKVGSALCCASTSCSSATQ